MIDGRLVYLSRRELALLQIFASNSGRVISTAVLARSLAGERKPLTNTAVWIHVHRLRARLKSAGVLIRTLRGFGYVLESLGEKQSSVR